jgi:hypothetical protein
MKWASENLDDYNKSVIVEHLKLEKQSFQETMKNVTFMEKLVRKEN